MYGQSNGGPHSGFLTTETPSFISHMPDELNGYLVFDRAQAANVVTWTCVVKELYLSPGDTNATDSIYFIYQTDKDYVLLPERVLTGAIGSFLLDIRGYDVNEDIVVSVFNLVPFGESPFPIGIGTAVYGQTCEFVTKATCNGNLYNGYLFPYAWDICVWEMKENFTTSLGTYLQMRAGTYTDANGQSANFWAYYNKTNYLTWCTNYAQCAPNFNRVEISGVNGEYTDPAGHPLYGVVMAVRKKNDPWGQNGGLRAPAWDMINMTGYFYNTASYYLGGNPQWWFINIMNNYGDFNPSTSVTMPSPVVCIPSLSSIPATPFYNGHGWTIKWLAERQDKLIKFTEWLPADTTTFPGDDNDNPPTAPIGNIWSIMAELEEQAELNINGYTESEDIIGPFGIGTNFSELVTGFYVTDFFHPETRVEFNPSDWISPSGEFQGPDGQLPAGFYMLTAAFSNGEIFTRAVEAEQGIDYRYSKSDMVEISVFPSPLDRNDDISFEFLSSISTNISYELLDGYGTSCLTNSFSVSKGDNTAQLTIPSDLVDGLVFHKFLFSDGSLKVVESIID